MTPEKLEKQKHAKRIAAIMWASYNKTVGGKAYDGSPLPTWEEFVNHPEKQKQVNAWIEMAMVAIHASEYVDVIQEERALSNTSIEEAKQNVSDIKVFGNGDTFKLLCKASSSAEGWMKSTKAMDIQDVGCLVQVSTKEKGAVAEALTFVPSVRIVEDTDDQGKVIGRRLEGYTMEDMMRKQLESMQAMRAVQFAEEAFSSKEAKAESCSDSGGCCG